MVHCLEIQTAKLTENWHVNKYEQLPWTTVHAHHQSQQNNLFPFQRLDFIEQWQAIFFLFKSPSKGYIKLDPLQFLSVHYLRSCQESTQTKHVSILFHWNENSRRENPTTCKAGNTLEAESENPRRGEDTKRPVSSDHPSGALTEGCLWTRCFYSPAFGDEETTAPTCCNPAACSQGPSLGHKSSLCPKKKRILFAAWDK